jgi:hypothetical protein
MLSSEQEPHSENICSFKLKGHWKFKVPKQISVSHAICNI